MEIELQELRILKGMEPGILRTREMNLKSGELGDGI